MSKIDNLTVHLFSKQSQLSTHHPQFQAAVLNGQAETFSRPAPPTGQNMNLI